MYELQVWSRSVLFFAPRRAATRRCGRWRCRWLARAVSLAAPRPRNSSAARRRPASTLLGGRERTRPASRAAGSYRDTQQNRRQAWSTPGRLLRVTAPSLSTNRTPSSWLPTGASARRPASAPRARGWSPHPAQAGHQLVLLPYARGETRAGSRRRARASSRPGWCRNAGQWSARRPGSVSMLAV
jgi:hypothetical protein